MKYGAEISGSISFVAIFGGVLIGRYVARSSWLLLSPFLRTCLFNASAHAFWQVMMMANHFCNYPYGDGGGNRT
jgi:hypothetical protein